MTQKLMILPGDGIGPEIVAEAEKILNWLRDNADLDIEVDLEKQTITRGNQFSFTFEIDPFRKHCLLNGLDDIGLTMEKGAQIDVFEEKRASEQPWV